MPAILQQPTADQAPFRNHYIVRANRVVVTVMTYLGIILTFGAMFPPLAVSLFLTMMVIVWTTNHQVGNFVSTAKAYNQLQYVERIEQECKAVGQVPILINAMWMLISVSACFYALFLFDTLGDSVGLHGAYWVLIVMPLMPLCMYSVYTLYQYRSAKRVVNRIKSVKAAREKLDSCTSEIELSSKGTADSCATRANIVANLNYEEKEECGFDNSDIETHNAIIFAANNVHH